MQQQRQRRCIAIEAWREILNESSSDEGMEEMTEDDEVLQNENSLPERQQGRRVILEQTNSLDLAVKHISIIS